ncbi:hypothetical protein WDW37_03820 [Bdellovibrionota bacterium FG-1]
MVTLDATFFKTLGSLAKAIEPYLKDVDLATEQKIRSGYSRTNLAALLNKAGFKVDQVSTRRREGPSG